jgi:MtN3 and saliva related transmembrane protein
VTEWIGFAAGVLTAFAFFPQVVKTLRTRSAADLSMSMLGAQTAGVGLWIVYGLAIGSPSVIVANSVTFAFTLILLVLKLMER